MSTRVQSFPIANGYKISHDMNVFPPVTERYVKPVDGAKELPKSISDAIDNWGKIKDFVAKHNLSGFPGFSALWSVGLLFLIQ